MAKLPNSFKAFVFQSGLEPIRDAYRASAATMEKAQAAAEESYTQYESYGFDEEDHDEDGNLTHSILHRLNYAEMEANLAITVVREAFITSAFHYWERSARVWTHLHESKDTFPVLSKACRKLYPLSPQLVYLNRLNNLLKHGGDEKKARLLARDRPDYFSSLFPSDTKMSRHKLTLQIPA